MMKEVIQINGQATTSKVGRCLNEVADNNLRLMKSINDQLETLAYSLLGEGSALSKAEPVSNERPSVGSIIHETETLGNQVYDKIILLNQQVRPIDY